MARKEKKEEIYQLGWVMRGKQRREIIIHMEGMQTPSEIAKKSDHSLNHTSKILGEFKEHKLVKLLNPKERTGRLYELTFQGKKIRDAVRDKSKDD